jgi:hypothetical protein
LRPSAAAEPAPPAGGRASAEPGEAFASDRGRYGAPTLDQIAQGIRTGDPRRLPTIANPGGQVPGGRAYRYEEGQGMMPEDLRQADPQEFPLPYMLGGPRPNAPGPAAPKGQGPSRSPATSGPRTSGAAATARGEPEAAPAVPAVEDLAGPEAADPRSSGSPASPKAQKKPVKIDPAILERLLQRNVNRPTGG